MKVLARGEFTAVEAARLARLLMVMLGLLSAITFYGGDWHSGTIYAIGVAVAAWGWWFAHRQQLRGDAGSPGTIVLRPGVIVAPSRKGRDRIGEIIAESGAAPGDIIEVDQQGHARVVGREPRLIDENAPTSEQAIRARLRELYGNDVADAADLTRGCNVIIFRKH